MNKKTTRELENILLKVDDESSLKEYLDKVEESFPYSSFYEYYMQLEKVKKIDKAVLCKDSGLERTYCYHILNGTKIPGRDKILCLCLAASLTNTETRMALEAGKQAPLYSRNKRDSVVAYAIINQLSVFDTNQLLDSFEMEPLQ